MAYKRKREVHPPRDWVTTPYKSGPAYKKRYTGPSSGKSFRKGYDRTSGYYGRFSGPRAEYKYLDTATSDPVVAIGGSILRDSCNNVAAGTGETQRIGRKIVIRSINYRYLVQYPEKEGEVTPPDSEAVRVVLYLDKQCNGTGATPTQILETASMTSFRNLANSARFTVLMDRIHNMNTQGLASDGTTSYSHAGINRWASFYKKCSIPVNFNGTTGVTGEIESNNIGILLIGSSGVASVGGTLRIRFTDY